MTTIGILGAGKLGTVLARLCVAAGYRTLIAASGDPSDIELIIDVMAPGAVPTTSAQAAFEANLVVLALPMSRYRTVPAAELAGKIVIDAMNYWPQTDGTLGEFETEVSSSELVQAHLADSRVVKALSHLGYHELDEDSRPAGAPDRHAIAIAGDDEGAVRAVGDLVDQVGFDPLVAGPLAAGALFGPGSALFGVSTDHRTARGVLHAAALRAANASDPTGEQRREGRMPLSTPKI